MVSHRFTRLTAVFVSLCLCFCMTPLAFAEEDIDVLEGGQGVVSSEDLNDNDSDTSLDGDIGGDIAGTSTEEDSGIEDDATNEGSIASVDDFEDADNEALEFTAAGNTSLLEEGTYLIQSHLDYPKVLDVSAGSTKSGANIQLWESNMTTAQTFKVTIDSEGFYTFTNTRSGLVLDVSWGNTTNGTNVWQHPSNNSKAQKWVLEDAGSGYLTITSALKKNLVLDVSNGVGRDGANIQVFAANGTHAQSFRFIEVSPTVTGERTLADGVYTFASALSSNMVLDISGGSQGNKIPLQLYTKNNTLAQMFKITYGSDGCYTIRAAHSNKPLDVSYSNLVATTPVQQYVSNNTKAQKWAINQNSDGTYSFINASTGMALNVEGSKTTNNTRLQTHFPSTSKAQRFTASKVENFVNNGTYTIMSTLNTSAVLDIASGSMSHGGNVQLWGRNNTPAQKFYFTSVGDNSYTIHALNSGKYLATEGTNVIQKNKDNSDAQIWVASLSSQGGLTFTNKSSGKVLDVAGGSTSSGTNIHHHASNNTKAQAFILDPVAVIHAGTYIIQNITANKVVDVSAGSKVNGANVQAWTSNNTNAQKWIFQGAGNGYFTIQNVGSKKMLDIKNAHTASGINVQQWESNGNNAQKWKVTYNQDGTYTLTSALGTVLNMAGGASTDGNNVNAATADSSNAQKFKLIPTTATSVSGDSWLDEQLERIAEANGNDLSRCFKYVANFRYISGSLYPTGNWAPSFAKQMIQNNGGNCYRYAALFCMLAKQLGYDASVVSGSVPSRSSGWAAHGWVEIKSGGTTYICDPCMAHDLPGYNWYWVTYSNAPVQYRK